MWMSGRLLLPRRDAMRCDAVLCGALPSLTMTLIHCQVSSIFLGILDRGRSRLVNVKNVVKEVARAEDDEYIAR